ncbi:DUF3090 domain-containing protein [Ornithinimicrobium sp. F0845]|uniref:DUF3090 domain-containing protein n=1 Tax=Ornithinimicrobium sp. F0845 TaxID=2926412 RepID=UPI001FF65391|nr:DUF3090 domain-containing protein [Ornithinimicrobium sp. F0845]MCK0113267.1 DUF3090 domain-containing protein [Ornithinimicrobium sp. F0845]
MPLHEFDPPERFITAAVGPPGQRTFFLQVSGGGRRITVSLEKEQVKILGERLADLLDQVAGFEGAPEAAEGLADNAPLDTPIEDDFRVQSLSLAWDPGTRRVVIEAHEVPPPEDETEAELSPEEVVLAGHIRVVLPPPMARAFAQRCATALEGGRPNCPFCGQPLDPGGHICPRANGFRR